MARTKASACRKSSGAKAPRKALASGGTPKVVSSGGSSAKKSGSSSKKSKTSSSLKGVCQRATPEWQKKITLFMNDGKGTDQDKKTDLEDQTDEPGAGCSGTKPENGVESDCEIDADQDDLEELDECSEEDAKEGSSVNGVHADKDKHNGLNKNDELVTDELTHCSKEKLSNGIDTNEENKDCDKLNKSTNGETDGTTKESDINNETLSANGSTMEKTSDNSDAESDNTEDV